MKKSYLSIQLWSWMNAVVSFDLYTKKIIKDKESKYAIIAIHGFNGDENSFDPVVELINFNQASWYLPRAPYVSKWKNKEGNSWFFGNDEIGWEYKKTFSGMQNLINRIMQDGFSTEKIFLMGFSQGACLALEFGLRLPFEVGGLIPIAGFIKFKDLLIKEASIESKQSPILLMHGSKDDVIPISASETTYQILSDMNYKVKFLKYDLGHKIPINKRDQIKNFIKNRDLARST